MHAIIIAADQSTFAELLERAKSRRFDTKRDLVGLAIMMDLNERAPAEKLLDEIVSGADELFFKNALQSALIVKQDAKMTPLIVSRLATEEDGMRRDRLLNMLKRVRSPETIPTMLTILENWSDDELAGAALDCLTGMECKRSAQALLHVSSQENVIADAGRSTAIRHALASLMMEWPRDDKEFAETLQWLIDKLGANSKNVRCAVAAALVHLHDLQNVAKAVEVRLSTEADPDVKLLLNIQGKLARDVGPEVEKKQ